MTLVSSDSWLPYLLGLGVYDYHKIFSSSEQVVPEEHSGEETDSSELEKILQYNRYYG